MTRLHCFYELAMTKERKQEDSENIPDKVEKQFHETQMESVDW